VIYVDTVSLWDHKLKQAVNKNPRNGQERVLLV